MRETETSGWMMRTSPGALMRALRFGLVALGIGFVMTAGPVRAGDDDDDDRTFEEKILDNFMAGVGATNMENRGIEYRERSPLVVPPKLDLPPPATSAETKAANWPKDPDEQRRKTVAAARKKENKFDSARPLKPNELNVGQVAASSSSSASDALQPGANPAAPISPAQLGYEGGLSGLFGGKKTEAKPFQGEPNRATLTMPPSGYQTPSPNYAYGTGPKGAMTVDPINKGYDPVMGPKYGQQ
jgi:hypothetical protein